MSQDKASPARSRSDVRLKIGALARETGTNIETIRYYERIGLLALRAAIPAQWEGRPGDLDKIFRFLNARSGRFPDVNASLRRVVQ
jgi:hypothetical protein